ncbi:MAG: DUF1549 domain-containing protein, partial [Verrucomicrobiota bacterium]
MAVSDIEEIFFETRIRPLLAEKCYNCHGEKKADGGLRLDSREAILKGGAHGPVVDPAAPGRSRLLQAVRHEGDLKMPRKGERLKPGEVAHLARWIGMDLPWPSRVVRSTGGEHHWAFARVEKPSLPPVTGTTSGNAVDRFVEAARVGKGIERSPPASRETLIRRLSFDLRGLPPTMAEVEAFRQDKSPEALEKQVDAWLASPRFGERWARHWLDLARYADTKGYVFEEARDYAYAYTYRDWVIRSFNQDLPYNDFLLQQIAGDRVAEETGRSESLAALGFITLGRRFLGQQQDIIDDRIDVVTRGALGLTVSCARCHDHKFDPIPTADYYSLYGVFASSEEPSEKPLLGNPEDIPGYAAFKKEFEAKKRKADDFLVEKHAGLRTEKTLKAYFDLCAEGLELDKDTFNSKAQKKKLYQKIASRWR